MPLQHFKEVLQTVTACFYKKINLQKRRKPNRNRNKYVVQKQCSELNWSLNVTIMRPLILCLIIRHFCGSYASCDAFIKIGMVGISQRSCKTLLVLTHGVYLSSNLEFL